MTRPILSTGGARGIGQVCALLLTRAKAGHGVLLGRDPAALPEAVEAV
jgi:NAD(P)-dependent dehydrogenase (short-subunit alcohol dehydrogenase family)